MSRIWNAILITITIATVALLLFCGEYGLQILAGVVLVGALSLFAAWRIAK